MGILYKMTLDCKIRRVPPTTALKRRALALKVPLARFNAMTCRDICREVRKRRVELWETQKRCEAARIDWLENEVKKQAQAAGDDNWEKNLNKMIRVAEERSINRKLTAITKGINNGALDQIEMATHDLFYSVQMRKLYHYEAGNFKVYPQKGDSKFYSHHFLKVLLADARKVLVGKDSEGYWCVEDTL